MGGMGGGGEQKVEEAWKMFERENYNINDFMNVRYSFLLASVGDGTFLKREAWK